ncbi:uncharacterized protein BKCO1_2200010 [Diplodia corticola]|uniref:Uncharacterized protein n=1 Tax=Diplodia corticola TaxID=236234 RepID=A0A1J9R1P4_9PEZI|nr:uncharacterized protein BKCO1_2200010 [Diplodia corticola]OJD34536.1 hypothetical protein BKCO1_2200010 [Diplodia corticola]
MPPRQSLPNPYYFDIQLKIHQIIILSCLGISVAWTADVWSASPQLSGDGCFVLIILCALMIAHFEIICDRMETYENTVQDLDWHAEHGRPSSSSTPMPPTWDEPVRLAHPVALYGYGTMRLESRTL